MAGLSKYLALALFNATLNPLRTSLPPPPELWLALHTAAPGDASYGNEATYGAYARQPLNSLTSDSSAEDANGDVSIYVTNGSAVIFPASTGPVIQTITHWAIWDSQTIGDGNILYSGPMAAACIVNIDDNIVIPENNLQITMV